MRRGLVWVTAWAALTLVTVGASVEHRRTPVDPDEIYWIGSAYYYHLAFERREWRHPDWTLMSARENPPVSKYVMGLGLALAGQWIVDREMLGCFVVMFRDPRKWGEGAYLERRLRDVAGMTEERCARPLGGPGVTNKGGLLSLARRTMLVTTVLASLVVLALGWSVASPAAGLVASQLFLLHPITAFTYNHAMADAVALLFSALAALAAWHFVRRFMDAERVRPGEGVRLVLFNGAALALACGAKMNSLIMVMVFGAAVGALAIDAVRADQGVRARQSIAYGAAVLVVAFALFVMINPAILADVPGALGAVFAEQRVGLEYTMRAMPELRLAGWDDKFGAVSHVALGPWSFVLGALVCLIPALRSRRPGLWLVAGWWLIAVAVVTAWIPIAWARYVLPIVIPSALLAAHALVSGAGVIATWVRRPSVLRRETA